MSFSDLIIISFAMEEIAIFLSQNIPTKSSVTINYIFIRAKEAYKM